MARLPVPGSDEGTWGDVLNTYLLTAHNSDGTLKNSSVDTAQLSAGVQSTLNNVTSLDARVDVLEAPSNALTDAATIAIDATLGKFYHVTLGGNRTLGNPTGAYNGQLLLITVAQDGTGNRTVTLDTKYRLPAGLALAWSTVASRKDKLMVQYDSAADRFDVLAFQAGYGA